MFTQTSPVFLYEPVLANRVVKLIFGRLVLVTLIVLGGWWLGPGGSEVSLNIAPQAFNLLLPATVALTAAYLAWLRFGRSLLLQVRVQFLVDTILVTGIVWETGDLISPYITLYTILIGLAGFFLGKTDALAVAVSCALCFTALPFAINPSLLYSFTGDGYPSRSVQTIAFNDIAFLLVGLLAGRLADRRRVGDALKEAESNFANLNVLHERIVDSIHSGIITTNLEGKIYSFNRAAEDITGIRPYHTLAKNIFSIFGDEIREPVKDCLTGGPLDAPSFRKFEATVRPSFEEPAEHAVIVSCSVQPLLSAAGAKTGLIFAFEDMTELRAMEEVVRRSDRLAAVGRLASGLAHEIRNPLGSMSSALQFLSAKAAHNDDGELMDVVLRESERLNTIITDFLSYARPGAKDGAEPTPVNLGNAIADCVALFRHDPAVNGAHIFEFDPPVDPVLVPGDEALLKQIIWNLARNSIKSMPKGGCLTVGLAVPYPARARITVSDTGCGIDPENIDKIFEPFHSGGGGTGLGLAIVHRIVTEHGGRIDAKSEAGKGTTITIDLPKR
jgi:two-component system sensor histidine kinase PilS (NtrC family)